MGYHNSEIKKFDSSEIRRLNNSTIQIFSIQKFKDSVTQRFNNSKIGFGDFTVQRLKNSTVRK